MRTHRHFRRAILTACAVACAALIPCARASFPTNAVSATINLDHLGQDFTDYVWTWRGYEDQLATLTITNDSGGVDLDGYYAIWKMSKRVSGGSMVAYIVKNVPELTVTNATVKFSVSKATLESIPDDTYQAECLLLDTATTNVVRSLGRGKVRVVESLFDDDDDTFSAATITNLTDYLTIVAAAATYAQTQDVVMVEADPVWLAAYASGLDLSTMTNAPAAWTNAASVETDPVWVSASGGVVYATSAGYTQAVEQASTAYGWGDHGAAGYATGTPVYAESDPIASGALAYTNEAHTAYGWGDHSEYGYLQDEGWGNWRLLYSSGLGTIAQFAFGGAGSSNSVFLSQGSTTPIMRSADDWDAAYGWGDHGTAGYLGTGTWARADSTTNYLPRTGGTLSGNLDLGGNTASNGTFAGTHTGDGSGLTGLPSGTQPVTNTTTEAFTNRVIIGDPRTAFPTYAPTSTFYRSSGLTVSQGPLPDTSSLGLATFRVALIGDESDGAYSSRSWPIYCVMLATTNTEAHPEFTSYRNNSTDWTSLVALTPGMPLRKDGYMGVTSAGKLGQGLWVEGKAAPGWGDTENDAPAWYELAMNPGGASSVGPVPVRETDYRGWTRYGTNYIQADGTAMWPPLSRLHVYDAADYPFTIGTPVANSPGIIFRRGGTNKWNISESSSSGKLLFYNYLLPGYAVTIDPTNNFVGIKDTTPSVEMDVAGTVNAQTDLQIAGESVGNNDSSVNDGDDPISWYQLKDVPDGFADGSDAEGAGGGSSGTNYAWKAYLDSNITLTGDSEWHTIPWSAESDDPYAGMNLSTYRYEMAAAGVPVGTRFSVDGQMYGAGLAASTQFRLAIMHFNGTVTNRVGLANSDIPTAFFGVHGCVKTVTTNDWIEMQYFNSDSDGGAETAYADDTWFCGSSR